MQRWNTMIFRLVMVVTLVGTLALLGCSSDDDDDENTVNASSSSVGGRSFAFSDGRVFNANLTGPTTLTFNSSGSRFALTSGARRATGTNVFSSCNFTVGNSTNPDAVGGGSDFAANAGPQPGNAISLPTCEVDTTTGSLLLTNSAGTSTTGTTTTPSGSGGFN